MELNEFSEYLNKFNKRNSSFISGTLVIFVDFIALICSILVGFFIVNLFATSNINFRSFINYSFFIPFIILVFSFNGLYPGIMLPPTEEIKKIAISTFIGFVSIITSLLVSELHNNDFSTAFIKDSKDVFVILSFMIAFPFASILIPILREVFRRFICKFKFWGVNCVVYIKDEKDFTIINRLLSNKNLGYHPCVILLQDSNEVSQTSYENIPIVSFEDKEILNLIKSNNIKNAIICNNRHIPIEITTSYRYTIYVDKHQNSFTYTQHLKDIDGIIGFSSTHNLTFEHNLFFKRCLDLLVITISLPFVLPIFAILCLLIKLTSKGPIFYGHPRIGKNGKPFKCWKFRSMCINSQEILKEILENNPQMRAEWEKDHKFVNDPRVTKFGKFLRKTSLDELPQLINIFLGQMSLVGPRPVTEEELNKYGELKDYVLSVSPGLSGMWQVSGRSDTGYEERISLDSFYIQNWSIWLDIWILLKTVWVVIKRKGAY